MDFNALVFQLMCLCIVDFGSVFSAPAKSTCPRPELNNGRIRLRSRGRMVQFRCSKGFYRLGDRFAVCIRGQWSKPIPLCVTGKGCPRITRRPNMTIRKLYRGGVLDFTCGAGLIRQGPERIMCDGTSWSDQPPKCLSNLSMGCDFEDAGNCGWNHDPSAQFQWKRISGETPTANTGPQADHTTNSSSGHYIFMESSAPREAGDRARFISPKYRPAQLVDHCLQFYYHMFGPPEEYEVGDLDVYIMPDSVTSVENGVLLFNRTGNHGDRWLKADVLIPKQREAFSIVIQGTRLNGWTSDIAIDDIKLYDCEGRTTVVTSPPTTPMVTSKVTSTATTVGDRRTRPSTTLPTTPTTTTPKRSMRNTTRAKSTTSTTTTTTTPSTTTIATTTTTTTPTTTTSSTTTTTTTPSTTQSKTTSTTTSTKPSTTTTSTTTARRTTSRKTTTASSTTINRRTTTPVTTSTTSTTATANWRSEVTGEDTTAERRSFTTSPTTEANVDEKSTATVSVTEQGYFGSTEETIRDTDYLTTDEQRRQTTTTDNYYNDYDNDDKDDEDEEDNIEDNDDDDEDSDAYDDDHDTVIDDTDSDDTGEIDYEYGDDSTNSTDDRTDNTVGATTSPSETMPVDYIDPNVDPDNDGQFNDADNVQANSTNDTTEDGDTKVTDRGVVQGGKPNEGAVKDGSVSGGSTNLLPLIVGVVSAVVVGAVVIALLAYMWARNQRRKQEKEEEDQLNIITEYVETNLSH